MIAGIGFDHLGSKGQEIMRAVISLASDNYPGEHLVLELEISYDVHNRIDEKVHHDQHSLGLSDSVVVRSGSAGCSYYRQDISAGLRLQD